MAKKSQIQQFREAARKLGADESEERFNDALGKVARHKPTPDKKNETQSNNSKD
jgi:hypothetical protein